jgi:nucleotide-binding universal stress UspA family protein
MTVAGTEAAIVVGVPPEDRLSEGTISFVVDTATRLGLDIELIHVVPTLVGGPTGAWEAGVTSSQLVDQGNARLDEAAAGVRDRAGGGVAVTGALVRGRVIPSLVDRSRRATLVVLQGRRLGRWERLSAGSVTAGVAARAHSPVVSVPLGWRPARRPLPITVGVEDAKRAHAELSTALGLAAASGVAVQVVRATYLPEGIQEILRREVNEADFLLAARHDLIRDANLPEEVRERVPRTFEVRWGKPSEVLIDASAGSCLLVLGRRDPMMPFGSHLGPVVRHVLRGSACPVMVVEPTLSSPVTVGLASAAVNEHSPNIAGSG